MERCLTAALSSFAVNVTCMPRAATSARVSARSRRWAPVSKAVVVLRYHGFRFAIDDDPFRHRAHETADVLQRRDLIAESGAREGAERKSEVTRAGTAGTDCRSLAVDHCIGVGHGAADGSSKLLGRLRLRTVGDPGIYRHPVTRDDRQPAADQRAAIRQSNVGTDEKVAHPRGHRCQNIASARSAEGGGSLITETGTALPLVCFLVGNPGYADCTAVISWRIRPWARSDDGAGSIRVGT